MIWDDTAHAVEIERGVSISALPILKPRSSIPFTSINIQLNCGNSGA